MTNTTDVDKLYELMGEDPGKYKEIMNNEHKVRMAMRNWPLVRAMAAPPVDIPPVLVGEKFEEKVEVKQSSRPVRESVQRNQKSEIKPKNTRIEVPVMADFNETSESLLDENRHIAESLRSIDSLKLAIAEEGVNTAENIDVLNVIELAKHNTRDTAKTRTLHKQISNGTKLGSLFSRLEGAHLSDGQHGHLLKLRQV